jgi:hypothetical protein
MGWIEIKGRKRRFYRWEIENAIIPPICRPAGVTLFFFFFFVFLEHVYVPVVVIVTHIFLWFYVQKQFKRPLWVRDKLPIQFLKNWQIEFFLVRFPRLCRSCSLWKWGHKSWIARCTSPLGCVSRVNRRLSKDSLLRPS